MRILNPQHGIFIKKETLPNNKKVVQKIQF